MSSTSSIISALGAGSGVDTKTLAANLVDAERAPRKERIDSKIASTEAKISAYGTLKFAIAELKTAFEAVNDAKDISTTQVSLSRSDSAKITASDQARAGSFDLEILQLAQAQRTASSVFSASNTPLGTTDFSLNISLNGGTPLTVPVSDRTPSGVVEAINGSGTGLAARLVQADAQGQAWNIVVTGLEGADQRFEITSDDGQGQAVQGLAFDNTLQAATDASLKLNGLTVTRPGNRITDLVDGVTIDLNGASAGLLRVEVQQDTSTVKDKIRNLVDAYNTFNEAARELTNPKSEVETIGGMLAADSLVQNLRSQVRKLLTENSSTPGTSVRAARDIGLSLDRFGTLQLDESKLDAALQNQSDQVVQMLTAGKNGQSVYSPEAGGLAGDAVKQLDRMLRSTGVISSQIVNAQNRIQDYEAELEALEIRMAQVLERYTAQFSIMDTLVGQTSALRNSLTSSFEGLMAMYTNK